MHLLKKHLRNTFFLLAIVSLSVQTVSGQDKPSSLKEIGIILNTVGAEMNDDYVATLKKLKQMGYSYIEGGYFGESAEAYHQLMEKLGLKSIAYGSGLSQLLTDLDTHINTAKALQIPYLVCYYPWEFDWDKRFDLVTKEGALKAAEQLNVLGEKCKKAGLTLLFHNHDLEFVKFEDGETPFDIIMKNTDPSFVSIELDVYWVTKGGGDPVEQLEKYSGRIPLLHMKDMDDTEEKGFACVGEGILDFEGILKAASKHGVKHCIVEHDKPADGIHCAQIGYVTLDKITSKL